MWREIHLDKCTPKQWREFLEYVESLDPSTWLRKMPDEYTANDLYQRYTQMRHPPHECED